MAANHVQKKNLTNFLSSTRYKLNVSKNDLFTDYVNINIHTPLNKFIFFLPNFIFQKAIYTSCILFVFTFCLNCLLFNVRCVLFHFFHAIVKFCVVFVEEIILGAITVKYGCLSTEITKYIPHQQYTYRYIHSILEMTGKNDSQGYSLPCS